MYSVANKQVVLTGKVYGYTRNEAQERLINEAGAVLFKTGGITAKTEVLVTGDNPGKQKVAEANRMGIPVVDWNDVDFSKGGSVAQPTVAPPKAKTVQPPKPKWTNDGKTFKVWRDKSAGEKVVVELQVEPQAGPYTPTWNVPEVEGQDEMLFQVAMAIADGEHYLLTGPTGTGKTTVCQWLAKQLNWNLVMMPINRGTEAAHLVGEYLPVSEAGRFEWTYGPVAQAVIASQTHPTLLVFDELNRIGNVAEFARVYSLLDDSKMLEMKEKRGNGSSEVLRPGKLAVGGTSNPTDDDGADYIGTNQLDAALNSRFKVQPVVGYPPPDVEAGALVKRVAGLDLADAQAMVAAANDVRKSEHVRFPFSFRELEAWARALRFYSWNEAAESTVVGKAAPDYRASLRDLIKLKPRRA